MMRFTTPTKRLALLGPIAFVATLCLFVGCKSGSDDEQQDVTACLVEPNYEQSKFHHAAKCVKRMSAHDFCQAKAVMATCLTGHKDYDAAATAKYLDHLVAKGLVPFK